MKSEGICCEVPKLTKYLEVPSTWRLSMTHLNALLLYENQFSEDYQFWAKFICGGGRLDQPDPFFPCRQQKYEFVWALVGIPALVDGHCTFS